MRYADDVAVCVRTPEAAERGTRSFGRIVTGRLAGQDDRTDRFKQPRPKLSAR